MTDETPETAAATEEATVTETATEDVETISASEATSEADEGEIHNEAAHKAAQKAARYRTELRTAQAERDALAERLNTLQRREVERLAGAKMAQGDDIWLSGTELADLLDEDGNVDAQRVTETASGIVAGKPHWAAKPVPQPLRTGALKSGASIAPPQAGWSAVLGRRE